MHGDRVTRKLDCEPHEYEPWVDRPFKPWKDWNREKNNGTKEESNAENKE